MYNASGSNVTLNHVAGVFENIADANIVLAAREKISYAYINGAWRQMSAPVAE
jgi:hypothetical protein